jgi:type I restriction enzyme S subunit
LVNNKILNKTDIALSLDGTIGIVRLGLVGAYSAGIRKIVIKNSTKISWTYLYCLLRSDYIQEIIKANAKGTTIIHAGSATKKMIIGLPPIALLECFESNTAPLLKLVLNLADKINILRQTRDLLLPKLISGELDVSNIDIKVVEAA